MKKFLKKKYKHILQAYKYYSGFSSGKFFCITSNGMTEFITDCKITDELYGASSAGL